MKKSTKAKKPIKAKTSKAKKVAKKSGGAFYAKSKRLGFRLLQANDESLFCDLFTDAKTMEFVGTPLSSERAQRSFTKALELTHAKPMKQCISVIVELAGNQTIGISSIKFLDAERHCAEGGLMFKSEAHSKRYSIESSLALIDQAFLRNSIDELSAQVAVDHKVGEKLVKGSGYVHTADFPADKDRPARRRWSMQRDKWAENYQRTKN